MSLQVYSMWLYRVEHPPFNAKAKPNFRHLDFPFDSSYQLHATHLQRLCTQFRVPVFEGYIMPSSNVCSETAALYKQLLLRPLSVSGTDKPKDLQMIDAFNPMCSIEHGATAFNSAWIEFS